MMTGYLTQICLTDLTHDQHTLKNNKNNNSNTNITELTNMERDYRLNREDAKETEWRIKMYPRLLKERDLLLGVKGVSYGGVRGTSISDPTGEQAEQLEKYNHQIRPVEKALKKIPEEYRQGLLDHIIKGKPYPDYAHTSTWKRWRRRLLYWVFWEGL